MNSKKIMEAKQQLLSFLNTSREVFFRGNRVNELTEEHLSDCFDLELNFNDMTSIEVFNIEYKSLTKVVKSLKNECETKNILVANLS